MTLIWLVVWFIANNVGGREPLLVDPVNVWAGTLILAVALDLGSHHASPVSAARARRDDRLSGS